ncbi:hypothetical protein RB614_25020 [Phytohabitans sp. ZYX-F-186]|uniref:EF-hand domain-containing protein n=1 Tax=Phytohabitans maris TaxID=3071409 RepID=A0ABU0ZL58_9ACTN|nr:hypothetical protein [Phytohabitans sp. ZYX-F-186]MDQ7907788.1 hypothetical protein [Phytohabitans sp. ZYX-F-186]
MVTGGWKKANDIFDEIVFAHGGETNKITRDEFVQLVESERAHWLTGVGPIFALYETVRAIREAARAEDRPLTPTEKALVAGTRRRTYAMFEAELAAQGDPGADLDAAREAGWTEGSAPGLPSTRVVILREGERVRADIAAADAAAARGEAVDGAALAAARERWRALRAHYREWLPPVPVSRCPDTGEVVEWRLDDVNFDGWFWEYHNPLRVTPKLPPTWRAMTGAVRLAEVIGAAPFIAKPGPEVPYVVPRILDEPDVRAVIAQVRVSPHTGWAITYYAPRRLGVPLANLWGADNYPVYDDDGTWLGWDEVPEWPADNDYDLRPWVLSGKLLWIAPDDETMTLRQGVDGCPYLDLPGRREYGIVERGEVRYPPLPPSASPPPGNS